MSTNKQDGKGPHQESVPPLTTPAKIVGNDVLPQAGSDLHEEIAKRRRETPEANEQRQGVSSSGSALLSESSNSGPAPLQDDSGSLLSHEDIIGLRAALKAEQAKRAKILAQRGNQNNEALHVAATVRAGVGTINVDSLTGDTDSVPLNTRSDTLPAPFNEIQSVQDKATDEEVAKTFGRLKELHTQKPQVPLPHGTQGNSGLPLRVPSIHSAPHVQTGQSPQEHFEEMASGFSIRLAQLREDLKNPIVILGDATPDTPQFTESHESSLVDIPLDIGAPDKETKRSQRIAALRKTFSDFRNGLPTKKERPTSLTIPTLTDRVSESADITTDKASLGRLSGEVDILLDDVRDGTDRREVTLMDPDLILYTQTYPVGLQNEIPDDPAHIEDGAPQEQSVKQSSVHVHQLPTSNNDVPTIPNELETKQQRTPVLHLRKVVRGGFFNRGIRKASLALHAFTKKLSRIRDRNALQAKHEHFTHSEHTRVGDHDSVSPDIDVSDSTYDKFQSILEDPENKKPKKTPSTPVDTQNNLVEFLPKESDVRPRDNDVQENYPRKKSFLGSILRTSRESKQAKAARLRAFERSEKRKIQEEQRNEEQRVVAWKERQKRIERMITGEEKLDEAFFRARFDTIDKKTESIREGVMEKIGREGMKLLSIFDNGASLIKSNVDTKTKVLAFSGMLAAAGLSLYGAPVLATGATISVIAAGLRIVSASGTYMTARMLLDILYKKAEENGKAYGNVAKVIHGTGAIIGSAALGTALGTIFEHFFPAEKIAEVIQQASTSTTSVPEVAQVIPTPSVVPQAPLPEVSIVQSGIENAVTLIPLELTEHTVKAGENLWSIIGNIMKQTNFEGFTALDSHAKDVKILEIVGTIMKDPGAYGITGGSVNHIAQGATLHLAKAFTQ